MVLTQFFYSYATRGTSIYNSHHIPKINSIWIIHLYVNPKIIKLQAVIWWTIWCKLQVSQYFKVEILKKLHLKKLIVLFPCCWYHTNKVNTDTIIFPDMQPILKSPWLTQYCPILAIFSIQDQIKCYALHLVFKSLHLYNLK